VESKCGPFTCLRKEGASTTKKGERKRGKIYQKGKEFSKRRYFRKMVKNQCAVSERGMGGMVEGEKAFSLDTPPHRGAGKLFPVLGRG